MNKAVGMIFSDKVNKAFNIGTFITLVAGMAALMFNFFSMKSDIDLSINSLQSADVRIEQKFDISVHELEETNHEIVIVQKEDRAVVLEVRTQLSGIQTDLKWLIADTKKGNNERQ